MEKHHLLKLSNRFRILPLFISCYFIFSPNECVWFRIPKIWKLMKPFALPYFIKHKPLISKEWVHITHPNTFLYFTTTDGQIFLSRHNQKLMKEKKKTNFFQTYSLFFFWFSARLQFTFVTQIRRDATVSAWLLAWNAKSSF